MFFQVSAIIWGVVYSYSLQGYVTLAFTMILRDFLLSGIIVATIIWYTYIFKSLAVRLTHLQVFCKPAVIVASVTFDSGGLKGRMGLCI